MGSVSLAAGAGRRREGSRNRSERNSRPVKQKRPKTERGERMANPVVHFEVSGGDGAKLQDFYSKLFDWKINADNAMNYGIVDNGGEGINGGVGQTPDGSSHLTFYVQVPDINAHLDKAEG